MIFHRLSINNWYKKYPPLNITATGFHYSFSKRCIVNHELFDENSLNLLNFYHPAKLKKEPGLYIKIKDFSL